MQDNAWFCLKSDVDYVAVGIYFVRNETNTLFYRVLEPICQLSSSPTSILTNTAFSETRGRTSSSIIALKEQGTNCHRMEVGD